MPEPGGGDPYTPLDGGGAQTSRRGGGQRKWQPILPVPSDAPAPPGEHYKHGEPARTEIYRDPAGEVLGFVLRFDRPDGDKDFFPLTYCEHADTGAREWRWQSWPPPRPLYGLDRLAVRPTAMVVVVEGEKAADAAGELLGDQVAVSSPNGAKAATKSDWTPLAHRNVVIWPDNDDDGRTYANDVARALTELGSQVRLIEPPAGTPAKWDAADALAGGWDAARAGALVAAAKPWFELTSPESGMKGKDVGRKPPQSANLIDLIGGDVELWHSADRDAFATVPVNGHHENWPLRSKGFRMWITGRYFDHHGAAPGGQALEDALRVLEGQAVHRGPECPVFIRIGEIEGHVYVDLADADWRAVEVTARDRRVIGRAPVKFVRSGGMLPLPVPEPGEMIEKLRGFINCGQDENFKLIVAWLVGAFNPRGPYPVLAINGEEGAAKSTLARMLRSLIDPNAAPIRSAPRDEEALMVAARNSWTIVLDNLSKMPDWLSDALCRLATGGGLSTRELYTNFGEALFHATRPIIINGIPDLMARPDLADRAIGVVLPPITKDVQRSERDLWCDFEAARPELLGAVLDAVSGALRHASETPTVSTRMSDFATWIAAAESSLGWDRGEFVEVYEESRHGAVLASIEVEPIYEPLRELMTEVDRAGDAKIENTPTGLLADLEIKAKENVKKLKSWPSPYSLRSRLRRIQGPLRQIHQVELDLDRRATDKDRARLIHITWPKGRFRDEHDATGTSASTC